MLFFFSYENFLIVLKCDKDLNNINFLTIVNNQIYLIRDKIIKYNIPINNFNSTNNKKRKNKIVNCSIYLFLLPQEIKKDNKDILLKPIKSVIEKTDSNIENNQFAQELLNQIQNNPTQILFKKVNL